MKKIILILAFILAGTVSFFSSDSLQAEQNFFNVPSSEITDEGVIFFQEQINSSPGLVLGSNTTLVYGLGEGWEIGLNVINLQYSTSDGEFIPNQGFPQQPRGPLLLFNAQKGIRLSEDFSLGIGTELGRAVIGSGSESFAGMGYTNFVYFEKTLGLRLVGGVFGANPTFRGLGGTLGIWLGTQLPFAWKRRIAFVADSIFAGNAIGISVLGITINFDPKVILSFGYQLPTVGSSPATDHGGVFEYTAFF